MTSILIFYFLIVFLISIAKSNGLPEMLPKPEQLASPVIGSSCQSIENCSSVHDTDCIDNICQCRYPFKNDNGICILGANCENDRACRESVPNTICYPRPEECHDTPDICSNRTCKCLGGYKLHKNTCVFAAYPGNACNAITHTDCDKGGICKDKVCQCLSPFYRENDKCIFGASCSNSSDCMEVDGAVCNEEKKCACQNSVRHGTKCDALDRSHSSRSSNGYIAVLGTTIFLVFPKFL